MPGKTPHTQNEDFVVLVSRRASTHATSFQKPALSNAVAEVHTEDHVDEQHEHDAGAEEGVNRALLG